MNRARSCAGTSLAEAIVALLLGLFLIHLGLTTTAHLRTAGATMGTRLDLLTATRIVRSVLRRELGRGVADRDVVVAGDSLRLRVFRGTGVVCSTDPTASEVMVAYRGDRRPQPAKDSVEVTASDGSLSHQDLVGWSAASTGCPGVAPEEELMMWRLDGPLPAGSVVARLYETGSYHLVAGALRYRIGAGGRQPLTPDVWSRTDFVVGDSAVRLHLEPRAAVGSTVSEFLVWGRR